MIALASLPAWERDRQATTFVAWFDRSGRADWRAAFAWWAEGKDFQPGDRWAISSCVERILSEPMDVLTDPYAYFRFSGEVEP